MTDSVDPIQLLTAGELAKKLNIHVNQVMRGWRTGTIPQPLRIARSVRWRVADIAEWQDAGTPKDWKSSGTL